jgi:hypothetical protein
MVSSWSWSTPGDYLLWIHVILTFIFSTCPLNNSTTKFSKMIIGMALNFHWNVIVAIHCEYSVVAAVWCANKSVARSNSRQSLTIASFILRWTWTFLGQNEMNLTNKMLHKQQTCRSSIRCRQNLQYLKLVWVAIVLKKPGLRVIFKLCYGDYSLYWWDSVKENLCYLEWF